MRILLLTLLTLLAHLGASEAVALMRTPNGGNQPQAVVGDDGTVHLVYITGDKAGTLRYVKRVPGAEAWSDPLVVGAEKSAVAMGTVRGAQVAIGRQGRIHVAWNGSEESQPKAPGNTTPMLYSRLNDAGTSFEPQRNLIQVATGLDGGGSIAADDKGDVWVTWHAMAGAKDESGRGVFVTRSKDDGATFARETLATSTPTGACGCCGMKAAVGTDGRLALLYRGAVGNLGRDIFLLMAANGNGPFTTASVSPWKASVCPMSTASIAAISGQFVLAWQTKDQIWWTRFGKKMAEPIAVPGTGPARKHPAVAVNAAGEVLVAWTEGTGWNQGGKLAWQRYDAKGACLGEVGTAPGVPVWGLPTAYADGAGSFHIVY